MPVTIQTLPTEVINLIAAGEVIDSIAAAVRELVENSLDAGATRIVVSVWPEQWRVQVADNGTGMDLENLRQAASPHSTSKITTEADLYKIDTLGFRGEALHSLAQLGCLEVLSRSNDLGLGDFSENRESAPTPAKSSFNKGGVENARSGWRVVYNNAGVAVEVETAAIAPGTVVTVDNLFGNWPVRRSFLSPAQQMRSIQLTLQQIAICHPRVNWQLRQGSTPCLHVTPGSTAEQLLPQFVRGVRSSDLQYLKLDLPASPQNQKAANLLVETQLVGATVKPNYQLPVASSQFQMPNSQRLELVIGLPDRCHRRRPDWVKVGVNRRVVRSPELEQTILSAFARTCPRDRYPVCFVHLHISPSEIDWNRHPAKVEIYLHDPSFWQAQVSTAITRALHLNDEVLPPAPIPDRVGKLLKASEQKSAYTVGISARQNEEGCEQEKANQIGLMELRAIAQVHNTYIVAEHSSGMWLVEQHIAHERVLYEQLCAAWQLKYLEKPVILSQLSPLQIENLSRLGLEVESFGEQLWAAREVPELLADRDDCADALFELSKVADLQAAQVATACRTAMKNGTPLSLSKMQNLLDEWQQTRNPRTCPHGRPIYFALEESTLARIFRRSWVIGKSHGI
ncbi:DNA mismatch repair protein MutL [Oscillatoria nigro-viridis PCC 7112]|uniref:DNA mismatch repair protein MutL n=1 Tax=Phormidium nigroviride PCC 7112 TaxID=179408 RepID=K9VD49_9CYAN|nr:DNA mismatch repair endonuclease MutL [Oscillatoria nigro-viridis]AFZ05861.1 DNA mismatch repair protein MutL [Oscillatoria nigro-viridis PCC 7112]